MLVSSREAASSLSVVEGDTYPDPSAGRTWVPLPRPRRRAPSISSKTVGLAGAEASLVSSCLTDSTNQVAFLSIPLNSEDCQQRPQVPPHGMKLGFSGAGNRLTWLNIPAEGSHGSGHPTLSFEIEVDQEEPDKISIGLMDMDEDGFIREVHRTAQFPARLLAELLSRRKATTEEARAWEASGDEE